MSVYFTPDLIVNTGEVAMDETTSPLAVAFAIPTHATSPSAMSLSSDRVSVTSPHDSPSEGRSHGFFLNLGNNDSPSTEDDSTTPVLSPSVGTSRGFSLEVGSPKADSPLGSRASALSDAEPISAKAISEEEALAQEEERMQQVYQARLERSFPPVAGSISLGLIPSIPDARVVGRPLVETELRFYQRVREAVAFSEDSNLPIEIRQHLQVQNRRGTYFIKELDEDARKMLPELIKQGGDLTDYIQSHTHIIAVFKPEDEVRGMRNCRKLKKHGDSMLPAKHGICPRFEIPNEVIAVGLRNKSAGIEAVITADCFNVLDQYGKPQENERSSKRGFLMPFIPGMRDLSSLKTMYDSEPLDEAIERFPVDEFQSIALTDISLDNTDRHLENFLYSEQTGAIIPIDQALIFPARFSSSAKFSWMLWDQAHVPFRQDALNEIRNLNAEADIAKILETYPQYPAESLETLRITYYFLKKGAAAGLTPFQIGCFLTGDITAPMSALYDKARRSAKDNPEAVYALMTKAIDAAIPALKTAFDSLVGDVEDADRNKQMQDRVEKFLINYFRSL